jgi:hypothetical protein
MGYLNNDNLTASDNCRVHCSTLHILNVPLNSVFIYIRVFSTHFSICHSFPTFYTSIDYTVSLFSSVFFSSMSCWCNIFHPHSFSLAPTPISYLCPPFYWHTHTHTHTHTHRLRIKPTEQFIRRNIETVHKHRSLGNRAAAAFSRLCTHESSTLPPPPRSIRLSVCLSVYSQLPACQCLNW